MDRGKACTVAGICLLATYVSYRIATVPRIATLDGVRQGGGCGFGNYIVMSSTLYYWPKESVEQVKDNLRKELLTKGWHENSVAARGQYSRPHLSMDRAYGPFKQSVWFSEMKIKGEWKPRVSVGYTYLSFLGL